MAGVSNSRLLADDYSGEWKHDMEALFRVLNRNGTSFTDALDTQQRLAENLGCQKIVLKSISVPDIWKTPTLEAGWTNLGAGSEPAGYYKDTFGMVHLRGMVVSAAAGAVFTLPAGYRPSLNLQFATWVSTAGTEQAATIKVSSAGVVSILIKAPSTFGSLRCCFEASDLSAGIPSCFPIKIFSKLKSGKASMVLPGQIIDLNRNGSAIPPLGLASVTWRNETGLDGGAPSNRIVIDNIAGLLPSRPYMVTLWAFPEQ